MPAKHGQMLDSLDLSAIFAAAGNDVVQLLGRHATLVAFERGQKVFEAGDRPRSIYAMSRGCLKIVREGSEGESVITRIVGPGEFVGVREVCLEAAYARSAWTLTECSIHVIQAQAIKDLTKRSAALGNLFMIMFANELARLERRLESKLYVPARSRVAAVVADLFTWFGEGSGAPFTPPVNRRDIAELADVTPETVSRALSELKSCGAIETKGASFRVVDKAALFSLARLCS